MSRIRRLGIRGIRNFGPGDEKQLQTIVFSHPLTLILGPNGTGKTTIIECLKYATTGEFPPGSTGGGRANSFIHDPLLTNESSVRALVKAEIVDIRGEQVTVSRRLECTQQKYGKKFQTLDSALSRIDPATGEKIAISHRCADIDSEMELALGVSKPILNYVIFCHQEESTWPLEDGKKLKERFDQIFDSEKYNKALEKARQISKKLQIEIRVSKTQEKSLKILLEEATEKKKNLAKNERRLANSVARITEISSKIQPIAEELSQLRNTEVSYMKLHTEKETKKTEFVLLKQQIADLKKNIQTLHKGTLEELEKEILAYDSILTEMEAELSTLKVNLKQIDKEENNLKQVIGKQQLSIGELKQQTQALQTNIITRNQNLEEMLTKWGMDGVGPEITETEASTCLDRLKEKLHDMEAGIKDTVLEQQNIEQQLQKDLDELRDKKSKLESGMNLLKKQIAEKRKECGKMHALIDEVNVLASKLDIINSKLQEANKNVDCLAGSLDVNIVKKNILDAIKNRDEMEMNLDKINKEVTLLQQQSSLNGELDLLKSNLSAKEKDVQKLKNKHEDNLKMLLNVKVLPDTDLKRALNRVQDSLTDRIRELNEAMQKQQRQLSSLETTKKFKERELQEKNNELENMQDEIETMCHGKEYNEVLLLAKKTVQDLQDSKGLYAYKSIAYKDYIQKTDSCCPLCHRNFENQQDIEDFKSELTDEINKYPNQLKTCEEQLIIQQKRYDSLVQLQPLVKKVVEMENVTLKTLREDLSNIKQKLSESHTQIEKLRLELAEPENKQAQCKDIIGDIALWDQYSAEVTKLVQAIAHVKSRLPERTDDKSMQEVQGEQESVRKELSTVRKQIESLQLSLNNYNEKLQNARETRNKLAEEQLRITSEVQNLKQLQDKLKDLSAEETALQESVQESQIELGPVSQQLLAKDHLLQKTKKEHQQFLEKERAIFAEKSRSLHDLNAVQLAIEKSIRRGVVEALKRAEAVITKYQKQADELDWEKSEISSKMHDIVNNISKQETLKRDMKDNVVLKQKTMAARELEHQVSELREKLGDMNYRQLMEQKTKLTEEQEDLFREKNIERGGQDEIALNIKKLKNELDKEIFRMAHKNYVNKCAEVLVQEQTVKDITLYITALDQAIIEYHEERMATVNKIILNLWELIYKGKDTTSIQIHTERTEGQSEKKRVYNYKVVQEKQKVTMDMKGHCSAGQKVLASIIIRMALAETFAKNCGIFALDEPTTNLDVSNMDSLAKALATIVNIRSKHQKNFQLIVISHDESFVKQLTRVNRIKRVHELYRNEIGLTQIKTWCVDVTASDAPVDPDSSEEEEAKDTEAEIRSRKRRRLAEERKQLALTASRKKKIARMDI
ncbi:DNA repair protein RAD50 [Athalia rosae]|uniref:DNA repair protein RAD50 n=1 Tax=Athalia rosae TaxID=37344 RepID=UPI0020339003|nr:DNA repair protein RAD50 [Athalia rosae]XP_012255538.2 DNA repair protein RAD50 [Athalia rosae]XP_048505472.1 DNA repair protein RAD50 [Athalia rosae]XP_048505473.1 DNA repair protein RAD50 [Athalia rosae]